jgi:hypothetical protein
MRLFEMAIFYVLFDILVSCFPLIEQGRIMTMEYLCNRSLAG